MKMWQSVVLIAVMLLSLVAVISYHSGRTPMLQRLIEHSSKPPEGICDSARNPSGPYAVYKKCFPVENKAGHGSTIAIGWYECWEGELLAELEPVGDDRGLEQCNFFEGR